MGNKQGAIPGAVRSWYSEIKRGYDYDTGLFLHVAGSKLFTFTITNYCSHCFIRSSSVTFQVVI